MTSAKYPHDKTERRVPGGLHDGKGTSHAPLPLHVDGFTLLLPNGNPLKSHEAGKYMHDMRILYEPHDAGNPRKSQSHRNRVNPKDAGTPRGKYPRPLSLAGPHTLMALSFSRRKRTTAEPRTRNSRTAHTGMKAISASRRWFYARWFVRRRSRSRSRRRPSVHRRTEPYRHTWRFSKHKPETR